MEKTSLLPVLEWLDERHKNALRIANTKHSATDRLGWMEDASYFARAYEAIQSIPAERVLSRIAGMEDASRAYSIDAFQALEAERDALNVQLDAMTNDRDLWQDEHNDHCPNKAMLDTLTAMAGDGPINPPVTA